MQLLSREALRGMTDARTMNRLKSSQVPGCRQGARILIVEDDPNSRWILCALLKRLGYQCQVATNGQEAMEAVQDFGPQVILMDLMMPVLDGLEATRRL